MNGGRDMLQTIIHVAHVIVALSLVGVVLLQHGKGADAGAAFGSGASATVFGSRGTASFLTRLTAVLATLFFLLSLTLAYMSREAPVPDSVAERTSYQPADVVELVDTPS